MEHFGHLFVFFATLNSAYIVSSEFLTISVIKINKGFRLVEAQLSRLKDSWSSTHDELQHEMTNCPDDCQIPYNNCFEKLKTEEGNISQIEQSYRNVFEKLTHAPNFNYYCLFGALYSLLMLILFGFQINFKGKDEEITFAIFNVVLVVLLFTCKIWQKKTFYYNSVVLIFIFSIVIGLIIFFLPIENFPSVSFLKILYLFNAFFSMLIPSYNFIHHLLINRYSVPQMSKGLLEDIENSINELNGLNRQIQGISSVVLVRANNSKGKNPENSD